MDVSLYAILAIVTIVGAITQGISGFAFSIVLLIFLPHVMEYTSALALTIFLTVLLDWCNAWYYRKHIVWKWIPVPLVSFFLCNVLAIVCLRYIGNAPIMQKLLGIVFIVMSVYMFAFQQKIKITPNWKNAVAFNAVGGIINGFFGVGGPLAVIYFLAVADDKERYMSTLQMFFVIIYTLDFVTRVLNGMVTTSVALMGLSAVWCIVVGLYIGSKLFRMLDARMLKRIVYAIMLVDGLYMIFLK